MLKRVTIYTSRREEREANGGDIKVYFQRKMMKTYQDAQEGTQVKGIIQTIFEKQQLAMQRMFMSQSNETELAYDKMREDEKKNIRKHSSDRKN